MKRPLAQRGAWRALVNLMAVLVLFFAIPVQADGSSVRVLLEILLTLVSVGVVATIVIREGLAQARGEATLRLPQLALLFEVIFVLFALGYFAMGVHASDQMAGIHTRIDALYFTATTMTTVGYGDIHPVGQVARAVTTIHLLFDIVFIAAFVRMLGSRVVDPAQRPARPTK